MKTIPINVHKSGRRSRFFIFQEKMIKYALGKKKEKEKIEK